MPPRLSMRRHKNVYNYWKWIFKLSFDNEQVSEFSVHPWIGINVLYDLCFFCLEIVLPNFTPLTHFLDGQVNTST